MKKQFVYQLLLMLVIGGIGGVLFEHLLLPHLTRVPLLKNLAVRGQPNPIVITQREEVTINDGVNNLQVARSAQNSLVTVYLHQGQFGSAQFRLLGIINGVLVTSDGLIAIPQTAVREGINLTVELFNQEIFAGRLVGTDVLTGLSFVKIAGQDLPMIRQGLSNDLVPGEKLVVAWENQSGSTLALAPATAASLSAAIPSLTRIYDFAHLNSFVRTDWNPAPESLGAVVLDKDGVLDGFVTQIGKDLVILRSEDLKLAVDNYLNDGKISWPALKLTYEIFGASEAQLLHLPKKAGVLVKSAAGALKENDFIYAIDGQELAPTSPFQETLLMKKPGEVATLQVWRDGSAKEIKLNF